MYPSKKARLVPPAPLPTSHAVSAAMRGNRGRDTRPELIVRKMITKLGCRYRLHAPLPGRPDIAVGSQKKAIFVHGCFWHQHTRKRCPLRKRPKSNLDYWAAKLQRNRDRDLANRNALMQIGWRVLEVWECDLLNPAALERKLKHFLRV